ncbi:hypothetical protein TYRP_006837 [Tyrophagus putrescentiae]|nr:hypothetical protein TYRP_006837 [Tyrophagus putrescentiae]
MQPQQQPSSVGPSKVATTPTGVNSNHSNNETDEPLSDRLTTPGTLSRSSTASLGVLNTLNEILAAAEDDLEEDAKVFDLVATMSHEAEPMDEPAELMGPASLATIDESLSPLPPLSLMSLEAAEEAKAEETKAALAVSAAEDPDDISLNSVEFEEEESKVQKGAKIKDEVEEVVEVVSKPSAAAAANTLTNQAPKMNSKMNPPSKMTVNTHSKLPGPSSAATRKSTFQGKFGGGGGGGGGSSKGSSVNASRTTTPTLSESEFGGAGSLNSLGSAHSAASLHKAVTSKLGGKTATPSSRLGLKRTLPVNTRLANQTLDSATFSQQKKNSIAARKHDLNTTDHPSTALGRNTISRSSTYTRSLNTAPIAGKIGPKNAKVLSKALPATSSQLSTKGRLRAFFVCRFS